MLAEKVRKQISLHSIAHSEEIKNKVMKTKEFKEYQKVVKQISKLEAVRRTLKDAFTAKHSTEIAEVYVYESSGEAKINFREKKGVSIEGIRDMLLLEDYFNNSSVTPEEMVDKMVTKLLTIKK